MAAQETAESIILSEAISEVSNDSQFVNESPKGKKSQKRQRNEPLKEEENDIARLVDQFQASIKKKKFERDVERETELQCNKVLNFINQQLEVRKQHNENLYKSLSEVTTQFETHYNAMKDTGNQLELLTKIFVKNIQQSTEAYKHELTKLKEIQTLFKKKYDDIESKQKEEAVELVDELDCDIKNLLDKIVTDSKNNTWELIRRSIFHAIQNDF